MTASGAREQSQPLVEAGVKSVFHYAPLHYLPFILRSGDLLSKVHLLADGYGNSHFRSTSARQDEYRGFSGYVHGSLTPHPPILKAKLGRGFPHFEISVPTEAVEEQTYLLCRFNIAKTRHFRGAKQEPPESPENGYYFGNLRLPVADTVQRKRDLLRLNLGQRMIEVLVRDRLPLPMGTVLTVFSDEDLAVVQRVSRDLAQHAMKLESDRSLAYPQTPTVRENVMKALERAVSDRDWKGDGLEFDRV